MFGAGGGTSSYREVEETDVVFLWGSNAREAHPIWFHHLLKGIRNGTRLYVMDHDPAINALDDDKQAAFAKAIVSRLDKAGVAYDIGHYRDAPTGLRIWAGCTIETSDLEALTPWLDWAFATEKAALQAAA